MGDTNVDDNTKKEASQVGSNWFGNLVYWLIGQVWIGGVQNLSFIPNFIGLWQMGHDIILSVVKAVKPERVTYGFDKPFKNPWKGTDVGSLEGKMISK